MNSVLIVDDEKDNLEALQRLLRSQFSLTWTTSPFEALKLAQKNDYSVIVSDQRMPEMNGVELLEKIKNISPLTTRILLTGYTDVESVIGAINRGNIYRYIAKPWDPEDLKLTLRQADEAYQMKKELEAKTSELEKSNLDLKQAVEELRALDHAKAKFLSLITHELNTPLTVLNSFLSLLEERRSALDVDLQKSIAGMGGAALRFSDIVAEVLTYVKLTSDAKLQKVEFFPKRELETLKQALAKDLAKKHLSVTIAADEKISLNADAPRLRIALRHLLEDCLRRATEKSEIKIGVKKENSNVVITAWRSGEKMSPQVFEPFVPGGDELKHHRNLGLALAICKLIVDSHRGEVSLDSDDKKGTTIQFSLPA